MSIDALGEVVGAAVELAAEAVLDIPGPAKRSRFWRFVYWAVMASVVGFLALVVYLASS